MTAPRFSIELRGTSFELRPLPAKIIDRLGDEFRRARAKDAPQRAELQLAIDIAHQSLRLTHPNIERTWVADALDLNGLAVIGQAMKAWKADAIQHRRRGRR